MATKQSKTPAPVQKPSLWITLVTVDATLNSRPGHFGAFTLVLVGPVLWVRTLTNAHVARQSEEISRG